MKRIRTTQKVDAVRDAATTVWLKGPGSAAPAGAPDEERVSRASGAAEGAPPSLTGGERVAGESSAQPAAGGGPKFRLSLVERLVVTATGQVKGILRRHGVSGDTAFVDWINFTVDSTAFEWDDKGCDLSEDKLILDASLRLEGIFGFGITKQLPNGRNFYHRAYEVGGTFGFLAIGGQRGTVMVSISGQGLAAAMPWWENRLHGWLTSLPEGKRAKLTRIDVAHDLYNGEYTVDKAYQDYSDGGASCNGRLPGCEHRGDWHKPSGAGRTFYIAKRTNGKFARVYEKGKQLGDESSPWVRIEVEFKSVDRILPFDILLNPGQYLAGAYPMFEWIKSTQERIATIKKAVQTTYKGAVVTVKRQFGKVLGFMREMEESADAVLELVAVRGQIPARFKAAAPTVEDAGEPVHRQEKVKLPVDLLIDRTVAAW